MFGEFPDVGRAVGVEFLADEGKIGSGVLATFIAGGGSVAGCLPVLAGRGSVAVSYAARSVGGAQQQRLPHISEDQHVRCSQFD